MYYNFQTITHGKWILAGEHTVLRGHGALVFPIKEKKLILTFHPKASSLEVEYTGSHGNDMHSLFWSVLKEGLQLLGQSLQHLTGYFHLQSNIPIGVGLGASAALSVAISRWFAAQKLLINNDTISSFAKNLENLFHGKSSGLDIAGVAANGGIFFKQGNIIPIKQSWQPHWYLSSCGQIGLTSHCIKQVTKLWQTNLCLAKDIDDVMRTAVNKSRLALATDHPSALLDLTQAIKESANCFKAWGLVSDSLRQHMNILIECGALATKPTGSGGGGYVLSLWENKPPVLPFELLSI